MNNNSVKLLTRELMDKFPVWIWDEYNEGRIPIEKLYPSPLPEDKGPLFIKAQFLDNLGNKFDGYLVGFESYYAFGIFAENGPCTFNFNLKSLVAEDLRFVFPQSQISVEDFFPIKYWSEQYFFNQKPISGIFNIDVFED